MINVLIVDDHALVRSGLRSLLETADDIVVVGEAGSGEEAVNYVRETPPDVVMMDVNMPGMGGIEATRKIERLNRGVHVIAVTVLNDAPFPSHLLDAGARGYISKGSDPREVFDAIQAVTSGKHYISTEVAKNISLANLLNNGECSAISRLTPREIQIMMMITQGIGNQEIADQLFLSPKTVSTYKHRLYEKLGVSNDVELTHYAIRHNLIDPP